MSSKNQVTIPVSVLREAGLSAGDDVVIRAIGNRVRIEVERGEDLIARFSGSLPAGTYPSGHLDELRDEWRPVVLDADVLIAFLDASDAQHETAVDTLRPRLATGEQFSSPPACTPRSLCGPPTRQ